MKKIVRDSEFESDKIRDNRQTYLLFNKRVEEIDGILYYVADGYLPHEVKQDTPKQAKKLIEIVEDKELSDIVDEAIKEVENGEEKPLDEQEEYKLTKEDAFEIKKYLLDIKDVHIEAKNTLYKNMIEILKETHFIKKSQSANNKTTYGLMFAAGVAFGMSDAKWMPFAKGIYEFFTTILGRG